MGDRETPIQVINGDAATQMQWAAFINNYICDVETLARLADDVEARRIQPMKALSELNLPIQYTNFREAGPVRCPTFGVTIMVGAVTFDGWGCSKIEAVIAATIKSFYRLLLAFEITTAKRVPPTRCFALTSYSTTHATAESSLGHRALQYGRYSGLPLEDRFLMDIRQGRWSVRECVPLVPTSDNYNQKLAEDIGILVSDKFFKLTKTVPALANSKIFAGIVITINNNIEDARVIAVSTGSKCTSKKKMLGSGRAVNDCRAEVIARRCFQRYLYSQLLMYTHQADPRAPIADNDLEPAQSSGYQLKSDRQVHMYINNASCKDCRCSSEQQIPYAYNVNTISQRGFRTKFNNNETNFRVIRDCRASTSNGEEPNKRLLFTTSCSGKLMKWCVVGLQGSLLSRLILPIYLHSLVLGSPQEHHCNVSRASCTPIEAYLTALPQPFKLQRPLLAYVTTSNVPTKSTSPSMLNLCWCINEAEPEIINSRTGRLKCGFPSQICKQIVYGKWLYLVKRLPLTLQKIESGFEPKLLPEYLGELYYVDAKKLSPAYQIAKSRLVDALMKCNMHYWVKKPKKQDRFISHYYPACDPKSLFK